MRSKFVIGAGTRTVPMNKAALGTQRGAPTYAYPVTYAAADPLQVSRGAGGGRPAAARCFTTV